MGALGQIHLIFGSSNIFRLGKDQIIMITSRVILKNNLFSHRIFVVMNFFLLFLTIVIPNSLQILTVLAMAFCFTLSFPIVRLNRQLSHLRFIYLCGVFVTLSYIAVGHFSGAPLVAAGQVLAVYVVTPLLWIYIAAGMNQFIGIDRLVSWFISLAWLCCASIVIYFLLFQFVGPNYVSFFKEKANLNLNDGYSGATMFVYGSLIFLCGGFFSTPEIVHDKFKRILLLCALTVAALTSGRSALILSIPLGVLMGALLSSRKTCTANSGLPLIKSGMKILALSFVCILSVLILEHFTKINVSIILDRFNDELFSSGGTARKEQAQSLIIGICDSLGFGAGHGIGVDYIRSDNYPWRYELVWYATVLRVGVLGALVYVLPFLWYSYKIFTLAKFNKLLLSDKFMFSAFICAFVASNTNPYIESFVFQWMYVFPLVTLLAQPVTGVASQYEYP